jgi:hypothetical protein
MLKGFGPTYEWNIGLGLILQKNKIIIPVLKIRLNFGLVLGNLD